MKEKTQSANQHIDSLSYSTMIWARRRDIPLAVLAWVVLISSFIWLLGHLSSAIIIILIAAFLGYALAPVVSFFERIMPRLIAIIFVYLILLSAFSIIIYMIITTAIQEVATLINTLGSLLTVHGNAGNNSQTTLFLQQFGFTSSDLTTIKTQLTFQAEQLTGSIVPFLSSIVTFIFDILVVAIISIYFLIDGSHIVKWLRHNAPKSYRNHMVFLLNTIQRVVGGYIRGQIILSSLIGFLVGLGLFLFHVPFAVLLGVLAFMLEFIPYIGTLISGTVSLLLAISKGWIIALAILVYFILVHVIESDFLAPRIVAKAIGLHPLVAIIALLIGGQLYGIAGALFASPIAGVSQAVLISLWEEWKHNHPEEFQKSLNT